MDRIGMIGELTKKQTDREYFSTLPIGTKFIILEEIDLPAYEILKSKITQNKHFNTSGKLLGFAKVIQEFSFLNNKSNGKETSIHILTKHGW